MRSLEEAVAVMLFYQVGELFSDYAVNKSRKSITELMDINRSMPTWSGMEKKRRSIRMKSKSEIRSSLSQGKRCRSTA